MSLSLAAAAETAPGNDSPCTRGRSVPVTDLSNGNAQYCIVLCRVAVVTEGESTSMPKKRFCRELRSHRNSDLSVCVADCTTIYRHADTHNDRLAMKGFHVFVESRSPCSHTCFYQSTLKFCHFFFSLVTSRSSVYEFRSRVLPFKASVEAAYLQTSSPIAPDSGPASHSYNFTPTLFAQLSSEYPMME